MRLDDGRDGTTALALANTIRHDGTGGIADDLATDHEAMSWLTANPWWTTGLPTAAGIDSVRLVRRAARTLFGMTVTPAPPNRADADRLMPDADALAVLSHAAGKLAVRTGHELREGRVRTIRTTGTTMPDVLVAGLPSLWVLDFLTGDRAGDLRSCRAPRCVRYFLREHGRQKWCKQSCGNRARVARHAAAQRGS